MCLLLTVLAWQSQVCCVDVARRLRFAACVTFISNAITAIRRMQVDLVQQLRLVGLKNHEEQMLEDPASRLSLVSTDRRPKWVSQFSQQFQEGSLRFWTAMRSVVNLVSDMWHGFAARPSRDTVGAYYTYAATGETNWCPQPHSLMIMVLQKSVALEV
jgi:hypothetical protein